MFGQLQAIVAAIRALYELIKFFQNWKAQQDKIEREKKQQDLEKAVDESAKAETDDEIFNNQDSIVANKPRN